jgi:hypothetical protein
MRKAVKGQTHFFSWNPPQPYSGTPSLTIGFSTPLTDEAFTQSRADAVVTAVANDRRTLTLSEAVATQLERYEINAFIKTTRDTYYAVKVSRLGGTSAILAEPLPRELDLSGTVTLNFAMSYVNLTALQTATAGVYPYTIKYADLAGDNHVETGLLKVTPRPFNTGLDHDELVGQFANLADKVPRRQSDFTPQIEAALDEIILVIRDHVIADNVSEDEVFNQQSFKRAHAYCSAAIIYEMNMQFDAAETMRARCRELLDIALRSITLDLDGDGVVDEGEENLRRKGGSSTDFRASWSSYVRSENDSRFTPVRGMRH